MPAGYSRNETPTQFRFRLIRRCEALAEQYEAETAKARSDRIRQGRLAKAAAERRNAELQRQKLAELSL